MWCEFHTFASLDLMRLLLVGDQHELTIIRTCLQTTSNRCLLLLTSGL